MIELLSLHDAIGQTLRAKVPGVLHVVAYPRLGETMDLPALLFGLSTMSPGADPGTGETGIRGHFQAVILVDQLADDAPLQAATLAARAVVALRAEYWDLAFVDAPENVRAQPEDMPEGIEGVVAWSVAWEQEFRLGEGEWLWSNEPCGTLVFGVDPYKDPPGPDGFLSIEQIQAGKDP